MKTYVFIYEGFVQFEVVLANYLMKTQGEVITVGLDEKMVTSMEGFQTVPHTTIGEVNIDEVDLFVVPGGSPNVLYDAKELYDFIMKLNEEGKILAAICAAPIHFAKAGILKDVKYTTTLPVDEFPELKEGHYINENVVVDHNIVTAKAAGYVDFAIELGKVMNIYKDEADLEETIQFFKYFKNV